MKTINIRNEDEWRESETSIYWDMIREFGKAGNVPKKYWGGSRLTQPRKEINMAHWSTYTNRYYGFAEHVYAEQRRAAEKFPKPDRLLGALMEEVGELAQALLKIKESGESSQRVYEEAVQVASTAYRLATVGEPDYGYEGTKCDAAGCSQSAIGGPCPVCYE